MTRNTLKTKKRRMLASWALLLLLIWMNMGNGAYAQTPEIPPLPQSFKGTVINSFGQPVNGIIEAVFNGMVGDSSPIVNGKFGMDGGFTDRLIVFGTREDIGKPVHFKINGVMMGDVIPYAPGEMTVLQFGKTAFEQRVDLITSGIVVIGNPVVAKSTQAATLYLVPSSIVITGTEQLKNLVDGGKAKKVTATANVNVSLDTTGLAAGNYRVYAIDSNGQLMANPTGVITLSFFTLTLAQTDKDNKEITLVFSLPIDSASKLSPTDFVLNLSYTSVKQVKFDHKDKKNQTLQLTLTEPISSGDTPVLSIAYGAVTSNNGTVKLPKSENLLILTQAKIKEIKDKIKAKVSAAGSKGITMSEVAKYKEDLTGDFKFDRYDVIFMLSLVDSYYDRQ